MFQYTRHIALTVLVMLTSIIPFGVYAENRETRDIDMELIFKVNKWDVIPTPEFLYQMDSLVIPLLCDSSWTVRHMEVYGAASPEGPWRWNCTLAENRKNAILNYINARLPESRRLSTDMMRLNIEVPEDYFKLVENMAKENDDYTEAVMHIVDSCEGDYHKIKRQLMAMQNGEIWRYVKKKYFAELRAAQLIIRLSPAAIKPTLGFTNTTSVPEIIRQKNLFEKLVESVQNASDSTDHLNRKAVLNIKTNLLFDFAYVHRYGMAYILNGQLEYYPKHGHFTPVISFDGPWWQYEAPVHKYFQVRNYQAEFRWYIRKEDARYDGFYLGAYGHGMLYGVGFDNTEGYQGEGWGLGISGGYVLPLIKNYKHIKLEFGVQVGYFHSDYDPYVYGCPVEKVEDGLYYYNWTGPASEFSPRRYGWNWVGPTRLSITFSYDLLYRKAKKKGISFKWHE